MPLTVEVVPHSIARICFLRIIRGRTLQTVALNEHLVLSEDPNIESFNGVLQVNVALGIYAGN